MISVRPQRVHIFIQSYFISYTCCHTDTLLQRGDRCAHTQTVHKQGSALNWTRVAFLTLVWFSQPPQLHLIFFFFFPFRYREKIQTALIPLSGNRGGPFPEQSITCEYKNKYGARSLLLSVVRVKTFDIYSTALYLCKCLTLSTQNAFVLFFFLSLSPRTLLDAPLPFNSPQARGRTTRMLKSA